MRVPSIVPLLAWAGTVSAATVTHDWTIDWVTAAPDGYARPVIGVNNQWPCPLLEANLGDTVVINLHNNLGNETTGLHFHGISQYGSPEMDGPVAATQCDVPPGSSFTYKFVVDRPGTYWYHSHVMGQYPDGLRGPLVVHDPDEPCEDVDQEVILTVSDWYHEQSIPLVQAMLSPKNTLFIPPFPDSLIVNEGGSSKITFEKGKTYRIRIINFSALAGAMVTFQDHPMKVIMQDGSYITPTYADQLRLSAAQRYDVILTANDDDEGNYPFLIALDINADYTNPHATPLPISWPHNETGYLVTDPSAPTTAVDVVSVFNVADDSTFTDLNDTIGALGPITQTIQLDFNFCLDSNDIPRACFNGKSYVEQDVPTLYSVATTGTYNTNPIVYGQVNPFIVEKGNIVEIVVNNLDAANHPFHLHGHQFQVIERPASGEGKWPGSTNATDHPASKDVVNVNGNSYVVLRFAADNPGVWLFHCHIEWHVEMGLTATIIEGPEELRGLQIPEDHIDVCKRQGSPYEGNAAGNTVNYTDTSGMKLVDSPEYTGALWVSTATSSTATETPTSSSSASTVPSSTFPARFNPTETAKPGWQPEAGTSFSTSSGSSGSWWSWWSRGGR